MNALFAQVNRQNNGGEDAAVLIFVFIFLGIFFVIFLGIAIAFLLTLQKALNRCHPKNRTMEPGMVWLNLIPCFSIVWQFITVQRIAESLDNEFYDRGLRRVDDFSKGLGTTTCVLNLLGAIPYIGGLFGLAGFVCWIIYWVKIAGYSSRLATNAARYDYDDDYDDRPRRNRPARDDEYDDRR